MAKKEEILQEISLLAGQNSITEAELIGAYNLGRGQKAEAIGKKKIGIAEILYYIGGAIVFLGIAIFLGQNWSALGFLTKIVATLGAGTAAYFVGVLFGSDRRTETASSAFFLISALVLPIGLGIVFDEAGFDTGGHGVQSLISGILLAVFLFSHFVFKKNVFTLFSIIFGTWLFFAFTSFLVGSAPHLDDWKFYAYRALLTGIAYMLIGHSFASGRRASLRWFLYGFGIFGFLAAALSLGEWKPDQNKFWELIYPGLVFGALFLSVKIKSNAFLTWGTVFLMIYILKITWEYFSTGMGWPLALVCAGLALIGAGYMSFSLKRKYLSA